MRKFTFNKHSQLCCNGEIVQMAWTQSVTKRLHESSSNAYTHRLLVASIAEAVAQNSLLELTQEEMNHLATAVWDQLNSGTKKAPVEDS